MLWFARGFLCLFSFAKAIYAMFCFFVFLFFVGDRGGGLHIYFFSFTRIPYSLGLEFSASNKTAVKNCTSSALASCVSSRCGIAGVELHLHRCGIALLEHF